MCTVLVHVQVRTLCSTPGASDRPAAVAVGATAFFSVMTARPRARAPSVPPLLAPALGPSLATSTALRAHHFASPRRPPPSSELPPALQCVSFHDPGQCTSSGASQCTTHSKNRWRSNARGARALGDAGTRARPVLPHKAELLLLPLLSLMLPRNMCRPPQFHSQCTHAHRRLTMIVSARASAFVLCRSQRIRHAADHQSSLLSRHR